MLLTKSFTIVNSTAMTQLTSTTTPVAVMTPGLQYRFSIVAEVDPSIPLDTTDRGELGFIPITGGPVTGDVEGEVVSGGGDWCLNKSPGTYRVEARYGIRTTSGAYVDVHNTGILLRPDEGAEGTRSAEYFMTTPVFRTTDPAFAWLTQSVFVGQAVASGEATRIDVFEVLLPGSGPDMSRP